MNESGTTTNPHKPPQERRSVWSWAFYDWANSAYATTIMAGFLPVFFKEFCCAGADPVVSTARLGLTNAAAGLLAAFLFPLLGAAADRGRSRKRFLLFFLGLGALTTACLSLVQAGQWPVAAMLYGLSLLGFSGGNVFYDALLPLVAGRRDMDRVSALGYALGYLGGGILLAVNIWMTVAPDRFGLADPLQAVRASFVTVGIWWLVFSIPLFLWVREPETGKRISVGGMLREGWQSLAGTVRKVRRFPTILLFLLAYWFYIDGVDTIIRMAVDYGLSLGFASKDLILALLMVQFIGFPSALAFGRLGDGIGTKRAILLAVGVYLLVTLGGSLMQTRNHFFIMAAAIGLVQGGVQALSRSFFARIIPPDRPAEFFGFFNMVGKFSVIFGPALVGLAGLAARAAGFEGPAASRIGILSVALLFLAGGTLLMFVDEEKGRKEGASL
ncbi:MAG: MFS transporter [Syntrophales bacterium]